MDIHQIVDTHIRVWSEREKVVFNIILLITFIALFIAFIHKKIDIFQAFMIVCFVIYLGVVFGSTVFTRETSERKYELELFWSWKYVIEHNSKDILWEIILNVFLLMPIGAFLPLIAKGRIKARYALLIGLSISATIEISQLIFMRGLFEWDDMIGNSVGCMIGCVLLNLYYMHKESVYKYKDTDDDNNNINSNQNMIE